MGLKVNNRDVDSLMLDGVRTYNEDMFRNTDTSNYYTYRVEGGASYKVEGLWLAPYYNGVGSQSNALYTWVWQLGIPGGALKDVNFNWSHWGILNDGIDKNITSGLSTPIVNGGSVYWALGWSDNAGWHPAITFWTNTPNYPKDSEIKTHIDFSESPVIIKFKDLRYENVTWTVADGAVASISDDNMTIVVTRVPVSTHIALIGTYKDPDTETDDTSISRLSEIMKDVYVDLNGMNYYHSNVADPGSIEGYKAYLENTCVYNKQKTFDNYWKKYEIAVPEGYADYNFSTTGVERISPLKYKITSDDVVISTATELFDSAYQQLLFKSLTFRLYNTNTSTTVDWTRYISTMELSGNTATGGSNSILEFTIPAFDLIVYNLLLLTVSYKELVMSITSEASVENPIILELIPSGTIYTINGKGFGYNLALDFISNYDGKTKFNTHVLNRSFWDDVKDWYVNNNVNLDCLKSGGLFRGSNIDGTVVLNLEGGDNYLHGSKTFEGTNVEKVIINNEDCHISSGFHFFESVHHLKEIEVNLGSGVDCVFGANNIVDMFGSCYSLETYPTNLIKWSAGRTGAEQFTKECSLVQYGFEKSGLVTIPSYPSNNDDDNTIVVPTFAARAFAECTKLVTIGPIIDAALTIPSNAPSMFNMCENLVNLRIKNLNHGDWYFDRNGLSGGEDSPHGKLKSLNKTSVEYMLDNASDLNDHVSGYNYQFNINNALTRWKTDFDNTRENDTIDVTPNWNYKAPSATRVLCRQRLLDESNIKYIVYLDVNDSAVNADFEITGLSNDDELYWVDGNSKTRVYNTSVGLTTSLSHSANQKSGFYLIGDPSNRNAVDIKMENGLDFSIPRVSSAKIYCPAEWEQLGINQSSITNAQSKGWSLVVVENDQERAFNNN